MMPCIVSCGVAFRGTAPETETTPRSVSTPGCTSPLPPFWNRTSFMWMLAGGRRSGPPGPEDASGKRPRVLAVVHHHLAADDHLVHAVRALHPPRRSVGPIVRDLVLDHADAREIEDHEIGRHALPDEAAVTQTHDARGLEREATNGVFQRQELTLPHPFGEDVARLARRAGIRVQVRAGVGLRRQRVARLDEFGEGDLLLGRAREE